MKKFGTVREPLFRAEFLKIFRNCVDAGFDTCSARNYANLELTGEYYHIGIKQNENAQIGNKPDENNQIHVEIKEMEEV